MQLINGIHSIIFSKDAEADRDFFRDTLGLPFVDAGHGWLIFALPPAELGIHPADTPQNEGKHQLYLMCADIKASMAALKAKGIEFTQDIKDEGWGLVATMKTPGGGHLSIYQPRHASPIAPTSTP
jgi:catechol 2,3-dioxygenase-like lactoylglutathione lyase family enzyme